MIFYRLDQIPYINNDTVLKKMYVQNNRDAVISRAFVIMHCHFQKDATCFWAYNARKPVTRFCFHHFRTGSMSYPWAYKRQNGNYY